MWDFTSSDHFPCFLYILYVHIALILWLRDLKFKTSNRKTPTAGYDKTAPPISYLHNIWGEDSLLEGITLVFSLWQQMAALPQRNSPQYPMDRTLNGHRRWFGCAVENGNYVFARNPTRFSVIQPAAWSVFTEPFGTYFRTVLSLMGRVA